MGLLPMATSGATLFNKTGVASFGWGASSCWTKAYMLGI